MNKTASVSNLVIGYGEIGKAITAILNCDYADINVLPPKEQYDVLHICYPYNDDYVAQVMDYKKQYGASLIVIHGTLKVGTTSQIPDAVYTPCRGVHPHLEKGIRTFTKFFGGDKAQEAAAIFAERGMDCRWSNSERASESLEAAKLWDTTQYGINILLEKEIYQYCKDNNVDFEIVYTEFNQTYNRGYDKLDMPQYKKYVLKHVEGPIGGHCVRQNAKLINTPIAKLLRD